MAKRLFRWCLPGLVSVAALLAPAVAGAQSAKPVAITFDDVPANRSGTVAQAPVTDRFASSGVRFTTPVTPLRFDSRSSPPGPLAHSGQIAVTTCYAQEFCTNRIEMALTGPTEAVTVWVGSSDALRSATDVVMEGRDVQNKLLDRKLATLGPSSTPLPANRSITVTSNEGGLARVTISGSLSGLLLDDVTVTPFVARTQVAFDPSPIESQIEQGGGQPIAVKLSNTGTVAAPLASVGVEPADSRQWKVDAASCPASLPPGGGCTVYVGLLTVDVPRVVAARLVARGSTGQALATAPLSLTVVATTTTKASGTSTSTTAPETTLPPSRDTPGNSALTSNPPATAPPRSDPGGRGTGETIAGLALLAAVGAAVAVRRRGNDPWAADPPQPRTDDLSTESDIPLPKLQVLEGPARQQYLPESGGNPSIAVTVRLPAGSGHLTVTTSEEP